MYRAIIYDQLALERYEGQGRSKRDAVIRAWAVARKGSDNAVLEHANSVLGGFGRLLIDWSRNTSRMSITASCGAVEIERVA